MAMISATRRILILGGTADAVALARLLVEDKRAEVETSLAGRTRLFRPPPGRWRVGGFGGAEGLARHVEAEGIDLMLDATHPFAARMAANVAEAAGRTGRPWLKILRPAWCPAEGDRWTRVRDMETAARRLFGREGRVFLAVGRQSLPLFEDVPGPAFLVRMIELPDPPPPPHIEVVLDRGPFCLEDEIRLLSEWGVEMIVTKNSGGDAAFAKLEAARRLALPVLMVERPAYPEGERVETPEAAFRWVQTRL